MSDWSMESQAVHGIRRAELETAPDSDEVAKWLIEATDGYTLISDAPAFDQMWLDRLVDGFGPHLTDFKEAARWAFGAEGALAPGRLNKVYKNMLVRPTVHRAGEDAAHLCLGWRAGLGK